MLEEENLTFPPLHENGIIWEERPPKKGWGLGGGKTENDNRKESLCNYRKAKRILIPCFHGKSFNSTG